MVVEINKLPNTITSKEAKKGNISFEDFSHETNVHREDVRKVLYELASRLEHAGEIHDWTKKEREKQFYKSFTDAKNDIYDVFARRNRIDVIEMISDCCAAGLARSGKIDKIEIDPDVLMKACNNTVELVNSFIELVDD